MPQHENAYIIRTHDRMQFLECRQAWDWASKIRSNLEPNNPNIYFDFGTAIHAGLEAYYDPGTWSNKTVRDAMLLAAFDASWQKLGQRYESEYAEYRDLGYAMLDRYIAWAEVADKDLTPLYTEIEFEVPIRSEALSIKDWAKGFAITDDGMLYYNTKPVYYQGRIDLIVQDTNGYYYIVDHKTAGKFDDTNHLEMDEQVGSYAWAIQHMLGIPIRGVIYNELLKSYPLPPKELLPDKKTGHRKFSKDKQQNTTYEIYKETLDAQGVSVLDYQEHLQWLQDNPRSYYRRTTVPRSKRELELMGERLCVESIDMLNDPAIYPAPTRFKCGRCKFRSACLCKMDGSDYSLILSEDFHARD